MSEKKIPIPSSMQNRKYFIDHWLDNIVEKTCQIAQKEGFKYVYPELLLSQLMHIDESRQFFENIFSHLRFLSLEDFIKQFDALLVKVSLPLEAGQQSQLTPLFKNTINHLKKIMLDYDVPVYYALLPAAIAHNRCCFGSIMLKGLGLNENVFLNAARLVMQRPEIVDRFNDAFLACYKAAPKKPAEPPPVFSDNRMDIELELELRRQKSREDKLRNAQLDSVRKEAAEYIAKIIAEFKKTLPQKSSANKALAQFSVELVAAASRNDLECLIGREKELESLITVLNQKLSNNAIILGKEGIGKTALIEGLAHRIATGNIPDSLRDFKIYSLNLGSMLAGCELRGSFEQRLTAVIDEAIQSGNSIIFLDEIHTIIGAGTGRDGTLDASNILKPYLSRGKLRLIGATTYDEYQKRFTTDRAFARRFSKIDLNEPNREETLQIIKRLAPSYAAYHKVKYDDKILEQIVTLADRYISGSNFPNKAITVLDRCGALYRSGVLQGRKVKSCDVERIICQIANLPSLNAESETDRNMLANLESELKKEIYGQDEAISTLVKHIKVAKAGFHDPRKPLVSAFLCGSSGCGKTELARKIAEKLGITFLKFDMSEYSEKYASSRLIGSAPGYVGYEHAGALTEAVIQNPHCVLLLDEIEKAHRVVYNLLLQVLDDGKLTDNKGRVASFKNAIILMTSNAGVQDAAEAPNRLGFNRDETEQQQNCQEVMERTIRKIFPPEFRNRLQCSIMMNTLDDTALRSVVRKTIRNAAMLLTNPEITLDISDEAVGFIAELAARENMGGRPVERLVDTLIKQQLVDELLYGELRNGGKASISVHPNGVELSLAYCKSAAVSA